MPPALKLTITPHQKAMLKQPLGELIEGTVEQCNQALRRKVTKKSLQRLYFVGDAVSRNAVQLGITPNLMIIDNLEKRTRTTPFEHRASHVFRTANAPGTIELEAWKIIEYAIREQSSIVQVEGEEDLLTLVVILSAPCGSLVVYGQPNQGIVLVRVTPAKKRVVDAIVQNMRMLD